MLPGHLWFPSQCASKKVNICAKAPRVTLGMNRHRGVGAAPTQRTPRAENTAAAAAATFPSQPPGVWASPGMCVLRAARPAITSHVPVVPQGLSLSSLCPCVSTLPMHMLRCLTGPHLQNAGSKKKSFGMSIRWLSHTRPQPSESRGLPCPDAHEAGHSTEIEMNTPASVT